MVRVIGFDFERVKYSNGKRVNCWLSLFFNRFSRNGFQQYYSSGVGKNGMVRQRANLNEARYIRVVCKHRIRQYIESSSRVNEKKRHVSLLCV